MWCGEVVLLVAAHAPWCLGSRLLIPTLQCRRQCPAWTSVTSTPDHLASTYPVTHTTSLSIVLVLLSVMLPNAGQGGVRGSKS